MSGDGLTYVVVPRLFLQDLAQVADIATLPSRNIVYAGGYYYAFYMRYADNYLVYRSSADGVDWSAEAIASHDGLFDSPISSGADYTVHTDGTNIIIAYPIGTYNLGDDTATTSYTRKGTPSGGTISWSLPVAVQTDSGYCRFSMDQSLAGTYYLAQISFNSAGWTYHVLVYKSADATSWTNILDDSTNIMTDSTERAGLAICRWPNRNDGILLMTGCYWSATYISMAYDGLIWSGTRTVGTKYFAGFPIPDNYVCNNSFSLVASNDNSEIEFSYVESDLLGGPISYQHSIDAFPPTWSAPVIVDNSTCSCPSLSLNSSNLYLVYKNKVDGTLYYRKMDYSTYAWDASATVFVAGEDTATNLTSEQYPTTSAIGAMWRTKPLIPYELRVNILSV